MKKGLLILLLMVFSLTLFCQDYNQSIVDPKLNKEILVGYCTKEGLLESDFNKYIEANYESYQFVPEYIESLNMVFDGVKIIVIMAVWCEDCQREIPRFFKILDHLIYPQEEVEIICVDSEKKAEGIEMNDYKLEKVPTFIFIKDDQEIGRIVEKPNESLEKDMLTILKSIM